MSNIPAGLLLDYAPMDREHEVLLGMVGQLEAIAASGSRDGVGDIVSRLAAYIDVHFKHEEALMQANGYPHLADHLSQHVDMRHHVRCMSTLTTHGFDEAAMCGVKMLQGWLSWHVSGTDQQLVMFLKAHGVADPEATLVHS